MAGIKNGSVVKRIIGQQNERGVSDVSTRSQLPTLGVSQGQY